MSFLAGIAPLDAHALAEGEEEAFRRCLATMAPVLARRPNAVCTPSGILAQAGHDRLWQGPKLLSDPQGHAAATGIQWRRLDGETSALSALARGLLRFSPEPPGAFDGFACAFLPRQAGNPVLATDPVGLFPICYTVRGGRLLFSSHQTFLRLLLGADARWDLQAVLEFLVAGHPLGPKTLLEGVHLLPPGARLVREGSGMRVQTYVEWTGDEPGRANSLPASQGAERLRDWLTRKREGYRGLSNEPVTGLLSGGWDSRLLVALFAADGRIEETLTTRQRVRLGARWVSEERIAGEVARLLGVRNRFVPPAYRDPSTLAARSTRLDTSTWFHDWAFAMADRVPEGRPMVDGLLGDVLIRGLFVDDALTAAQQARDRPALQGILHRRFLQGFNTYTPGVEAWQSVLRPEVLRAFENRLWQVLEEELAAVDHPEPVTFFLLRNRSRRAIAPLPRLVLGRRGDVHLPFCDPEFLRRALSLPLEGRRDGSVYRHLLDRVRPGLAAVPSTNETDLRRMAPYLTDTLPEATLRGRLERKQARLQALCDEPPRVLAPILTSEVRRALAARDGSVLEPRLLLLEKMQMVEALFRMGVKTEKE